MRDTPGTPPERRRGRPPRSEEATPTGYRAAKTTKRQLDMARQFTGHASLQAIIDAAVRAYVVALAASTPEYRTALEALEADAVKKGLPEAHRFATPAGWPVQTNDM